MVGTGGAGVNPQELSLDGLRDRRVYQFRHASTQLTANHWYLRQVDAVRSQSLSFRSDNVGIGVAIDVTCRVLNGPNRRVHVPGNRVPKTGLQAARRNIR